MPSLVFISEDSHRQVFPLGRSTLMIGRADESGIRLPSDSISSNHASIVLDQGHFVLRDNGSTNGTYVNGARITHYTLKHHDVVRFGEYLFMVDMEEAESGPIQETPSASLPVSVENKIENPQSVAQITDKTGVQSIPVGTLQNVPTPVPQPIPKAQPQNVPQSPSQLVPRAMPQSLQITAQTRSPGQAMVVPSSSAGLTLILTPPVPGVGLSSHTDYGLLSLIFGWMGLVTFLPAIAAIFYGHKTPTTTPHARLQRKIGLGLGYAGILIWFGFGIFLFVSPQLQEKFGIKQALSAESMLKIQVPVVSDAWALLLGQMTWAPLGDARSMILSEDEASSSSAAPQRSSKTNSSSALRQFTATWMHGVVIYEPAILGVGKNMEEQVFQLVIEDYLTRPTTFGSYNTTVIPEKKSVIGPFYVPNLSSNLFHAQNRLQQSMAKNLFYENGETQFPWATAVRGIQWSLQGLPAIRDSDISRLQWLVFLRPATRVSPLILTTQEGDVQHSKKKTYTFDVFPSEVLVEILYLGQPNEFIAVRFNEAFFSQEEMQQAKELLRSNFKDIFTHRPKSADTVPSVFGLKMPKNTGSL